MDQAPLIAALLKARAAFDPVLKDSTNPHFRSKYASLGAVLRAVEDALAAQGLLLLQATGIDDRGEPYLTTEIVHASGARVGGRYPLRPSKPNDPQALAACLTYARRYSILCVCGVAPAPEDDDGNDASDQPRRQREPATPRAAVVAHAAARPADSAGESRPQVAALLKETAGLKEMPLAANRPAAALVKARMQAHGHDLATPASYDAVAAAVGVDGGKSLTCADFGAIMALFDRLDAERAIGAAAKKAPRKKVS